MECAPSATILRTAACPTTWCGRSWKTAGQLWIGTFNGLDLLDRKTGKFRHFRREANNPRSLSHDEVHYLYEDGAAPSGSAPRRA
jgi:hypothetical protein